jgi:hypothetical protein
MKKIKLFTATDINKLQSDINEWLSMHKEAHILESNITSLSAASNPLGSAKSIAEYAFYFLYSPANESEEESVLTASKQMPEELAQAINNITEAN